MRHPIAAAALLLLIHAATAALIDENLLRAYRLAEITAYGCPDGAECRVTCNAGEDQAEFERRAVTQLELAASPDTWLVALSHGSDETTSAILPRPASCVFDNLEVLRHAPVVDGVPQWPTDKGDVVFDLVPDR